MQGAPFGRHTPVTPQWPALHSPVQQTAAEVHASPSKKQGPLKQAMPLQGQSQHMAPAKLQPAPRGWHPQKP
jgi:hypothetical protein